MELIKELTRDEMKNVMAGFNMACDGKCLHCHTESGGYESWARSEEPEDGAEAGCEDIYNYPADEVDGIYNDCSVGLEYDVAIMYHCG